MVTRTSLPHVGTGEAKGGSTVLHSYKRWMVLPLGAFLIFFSGERVMNVGTALSSSFANLATTDTRGLSSSSITSPEQQPKGSNPALDPRITTTTEEELAFWKEKGECLYVEDLCHVGHEWFYRPQDVSDNERNKSAVQPIFSLDRKGTLPPGYPQIIQVRNSSGFPDSTVEKLQCSTSPIAHHLVMYGWCDHMMGDFYHGILKSTTHLLKEHAPIPEDQLQFYLHPSERHKLMDGHRIFLSTLPSSNPVLPFNSLLDMNRCQCLPRVSFCGYSNKPNTEVSDHVYETGMQVSPTFLKANTDLLAKETRENIVEQVYKSNPFFANMVTLFRKKTLQGNNVDPAEESSWKILGLGQRSGRRRWLNLDEIIQSCNARFRDRKLMCVEMNVEIPGAHVVQQAVMHAGLNGFVGIHGSQLVDAMFMPRGSPVLELLPWFPFFAAWGSWTRNTKQTAHTWFSTTDLNHYGYPLGRSSTAQICNNTIHKRDVYKDALCWKRVQYTDIDQFKWDMRDYIVDWPIVESFVVGFVIDPIDTCDGVQKRQRDNIVVEGDEHKQFTIYNVNCKLAADSVNTTNQYLVYLTNYTDIEQKEAPQKIKEFDEWQAVRNIKFD